MNKEGTFSSPNKMVWEYFDCLRSIARRAAQTEREPEQRQETAMCIIMAVTIVEIFLNLYLRIVIEENGFSKNKTQVLKDMNGRCSLDKKLKTWPQLIFGKKLRLESGPGKDFMDLKRLRNNLVHFKSSWETINFPGVVINGMANTTDYNCLKPSDAENAVMVAENMLAEIFRLRGMTEQQISYALHLWAAKVPSNLALNPTGITLRSTPSG